MTQKPEDLLLPLEEEDDDEDWWMEDYACENGCCQCCGCSCW